MRSIKEIRLQGLALAFASRRRALGFTPKDLAQEVGVSLAAIQRLEVEGTWQESGKLPVLLRTLDADLVLPRKIPPCPFQAYRGRPAKWEARVVALWLRAGGMPLKAIGRHPKLLEVLGFPLPDYEETIRLASQCREALDRKEWKRAKKLRGSLRKATKPRVSLARLSQLTDLNDPLTQEALGVLQLKSQPRWAQATAAFLADLPKVKIPGYAEWIFPRLVARWDRNKEGAPTQFFLGDQRVLEEEWRRKSPEHAQFLDQLVAAQEDPLLALPGAGRGWQRTLRNLAIVLLLYNSGASVSGLAKEFHLSPRQIYRIKDLGPKIRRASRSLAL